MLEEEIKQHAEEAWEVARDIIARTHPAFAHNRTLTHRTEETLQHIQARRERAEEQRALRAASGVSPTETPVQHSQPPEILLIEDNPGDSRLFQEALTECDIPYRVSILRQGSDVLAFVRREGTFAQIPPPQLIVLDVNLPGMSPEEVLAALRRVPAYQTVPVIVFSGLPEEEGRRLSTQLGATAFIHKPGNLPDFFAAVQALVRKWCGPMQTSESAKQ